jgi:hypothetical protein
VLLVAGCAAGHPGTVIGHPQTAAGHPGAAAYLAIAREGNSRLEIDFDRLGGPDAANLAAARADLRDAAATEHLFDQRLAALALPAPTDAVARTLVAVNESRAKLTTEAATASMSPHLLQQYEQRLSAANAPVEQAVTTIRSQLGLPPPATS